MLKGLYEKVASCGLVLTVCECRLHAAKRRLLGCRMFRKLATTSVARGQLADRLKPQAALLFFHFLPVSSLNSLNLSFYSSLTAIVSL
mgnify:CR=1 FL=1